MEKPYYCCNECGSTNIEVRAWVDPNTDKYISDIDDGECYCRSCMRETPIKYVEEDETN